MLLVNWGFLDVMHLILSLYALYYLFGLIKALFKKRRLAALLNQVRPLNPHSKPQDYVYFYGQIEYPQSETPFLKHRCSYWKARFEAEFQTKRKKPESGMQTHTPVLLKKNNEKEPLVLSEGSRTVHLLLADVHKYLVNPKHQVMTYSEPTFPEILPLAKPKYTKYRVHETWLPRAANVLVLGTIQAIDDEFTTVGTGTQSQYPTLVFLGRFADLKQRLFNKNKSLMLLIGGLIAFLGLDWAYLYSHWSAWVLLVLLGIGLGASSILKKQMRLC